ncbi:kinase-like domain-containing protein [Halteromyces radiatus]|uniref:kinase-like domain-containing protein n=1 Tax=Halteromyces radiatus TaxID=101107 RepID=UPI00221F6058|nr:kinase-like domain-containing protein [Halteromyces radiatus]KAI8079983.1 kinase-like domain-containing protein [Halteromyces radiatus]
MISNGSTSSTSSTTSTNVSPLSAASLESEYAKIRPYIPERKSSNPVQISKIMKQFNVPPTLPLARTRPNPIIARRTNNGNQSQHRQQQQQQQQNRHLEQRIQVTLDSDTFFSLTVTNITDPIALKMSIVKKLGMTATSLEQYQFYHENGDNSDIPLDDDQLVYICGHSDNSKHRILLKSTSPLINMESTSPSSAQPSIAQQQQQQQQQQEQQTVSLWAVPPRSLQTATPPSPRQSEENQTESVSAPLWAVPPQPIQHRVVDDQPISAPLWAVPPRPLQPVPQEQMAASLWAVPPSQNTTSLSSSAMLTGSSSTSTSASLWAIPPKNIYQDQEHQQSQQSQDTLSSGLWAVPPRLSPSNSSSTSSSVHDSSNTNAKSTIPTSSQQLKPQGLSTSSPSVSNALRTPQSSSENGSPISSSQDLTDTEEDNWAERPSIERLYRDIDKYLPGHDLDKEIMLEGEHATTTRHKKSIRVVAKEAHRNWRQAVNVIRVNNILRRRSTKMWGHKVQQVKPGMALANEKEDNTTTLHDAPTKLQWMRGQLIGKGSYGRVYHALNVAAGEWIAVKQVDIPTTSSDRHNQQLHDTADALYREIQLLKDLEHDNIVQYLGYDVDEEEGHINIFLEYVPGGSIASCLSKQGKFEESLVSYFTRQILLGLEYLHDRNILHRDIKAGNVLLTHTGTCKITDFGLSKLSGQDKAYDAHGNNSVMRGTVFWMAPEVVSGTNYNAKVDIWSLGCTVIEMLTGKHPWLDMNMLAALYSLGRFEAPPIPEGIHENAKSFLKQCFTINPEERPTAADLLVHPFVGQNPSFKFKVRK